MEEWVKQSLENAARMLQEAGLAYQANIDELNDILMTRKRAAWDLIKQVEATCPHTEEVLKKTTHDYHQHCDWDHYHCKLCNKLLRRV